MISLAHIEQIKEQLADDVIGADSVDKLRSQFSDIHFTYCMDDDVYAATPVVEAENYNLYLIDSRNHCLAFTQDREIATGIVVAEVEPDEE
ncbi:MAG: DUF6129 family protein [Candidatus Thiodiazotropha sp.]